MSYSQRIHLCAATLALFGVLSLFLGSSEAATSSAKSPIMSWTINLETGFRGEGKASLSFPDLPRTLEVSLDGPELTLQLESANPPRQVALRFPDGRQTRGFLMQAGNELTGNLAPAEKPEPADRQHWRARSDHKHDWKSPLANAPFQLEPGPAPEMAYRRAMPTVRLESHEGDHKH